VIQARRFREQAANRDDARARLLALIREQLTPPKPRIATKPSRGARERRLESKQQRGQIKRRRRRDWSGD